MKDNNRNSIASRGKLPQFTTMNVIDGQAVLVIYSSLIFYSLTIDNILNIVVLLILATVSISMLGGENGIITQASDAKDKTDQARVEELVGIAIGSLTAENQGDKSVITPGMIAEEVNKMENRTDVKSEGSAFPTNIIFEAEGRKVGVDINISVTEAQEKKMYNEEGVETKIAAKDLFLYEIIDYAEIGAINMDKLPTKRARITGMNPEFCNSTSNDENYENTNYEIIYNGEKISDTLVIPYQVEIQGEMYKITEVNLFAYHIYEGNMNSAEFPKIETVIYPNTVEKIFGTHPAYGLVEYYHGTLKRVVLPNNLKEIDSSAFAGCTGLTSITIPESVTSIGTSAFSYCSGLTSITIPDSVTSIGNSAFYGCSSLTSITIPNSVTSIGNYAFSYCRGLTSITIPDNVTSIGNSAFERCSSLTSITIPDTVTSIGNSAFDVCSSLTTVNYKGTEEQWNQITIGLSNTGLTNATINYNYTGK